MNEAYDLVIIGGGSTGLTAAGFAVQLGARVALVEKHRLGGECTWTGCVPSKTLVKVAKVAHEMRTADRFGLTPIEPAVDLKSVMARVGGVVANVYRDESPDTLRADGIDVFLAAARFVDPQTVAAGETTLTARHVLIATGAHPFIPPISGLEGVDYLTYESVWDLGSPATAPVGGGRGAAWLRNGPDLQAAGGRGHASSQRRSGVAP